MASTQITNRPKAAPVLISSTLGAFVGGGIGFALSSSDDLSPGWAAGFSAGAGLCALAGAAITDAKLSTKRTLTWTALGSVPLILYVTKESRRGDYVVVPLCALPIVGAFFGSRHR